MSAVEAKDVQTGGADTKKDADTPVVEEPEKENVAVEPVAVDAKVAPQPQASGAAATTSTATTSGGGGARPQYEVPQGRPSPKLYVGNLHPLVTEANLIRLFQPFGRIDRLQFVWHTAGPKRGQPRGFAFVEYGTEAEATKAVKALNNYEMKGRNICVRYLLDQDNTASDPRAMLRKAKARTMASGTSGNRGYGNDAAGPDSRRGTVVVLGGSISRAHSAGAGRANGWGDAKQGAGSESLSEDAEAGALERKINQLKRKLETYST